MHAQSMQQHPQQPSHGSHPQNHQMPNPAQQNGHPPHSQTPPVQAPNTSNLNNHSLKSNNNNQNMSNNSAMHQQSNQASNLNKNAQNAGSDYKTLVELHRKNENMLHKSYYDPGYPGELNEWTVLEYFCQPTNPFFDKTSNNAIIQQQQIHMEKLLHMKGIEYQVLYAQPPIMFIVQKVE